MRYPNIQLLRVAAAVGVALFHLGFYARTVGQVELIGLDNSWLAGMPVPLFFAVSGFVLAGAARHTSPGRFLIARVVRLYPGYWLAVLLTLAAATAGLFSDLQSRFPGLVSGRTFALWPARFGTVLYPLGIEWSLVYEVVLSAAVGLFSLAGPRFGLPILSGVWLTAIVCRMIVWPVTNQLPAPLGSLSEMVQTSYNVPFLVGVLIYSVRDQGRRLWPFVLTGVLGLLAAGVAYPVRPEVQWALWGVAAAGIVWLVVGRRQVASTNPLARLGDCTYGLFLVHVPLLWLVLYPAARAGWGGRVEPALLAGLLAIVGGLLYGRLEAVIHARLRLLPDRLHVSFLRPAAGRLGWPLRPTPATAPSRRNIP